MCHFVDVINVCRNKKKRKREREGERKITTTIITREKKKA